jgi:hypothetical protein
MIKLKNLLKTLCAFSGALFFALAAQPVNAAGAAITLSPGNYKVTMQPGTKYQASFKLTNTGEKTLNYRVYATPYSIPNTDDDASDGYSNPSLDVANEYTKMSEWIKIDESGDGTLEPLEATDINYTISVPEDAAPGGQYAAIAVEQINNQEVAEGQAGYKSVIRSGMVIYGVVAGQADNSGSISQSNISTFFFNPPISASSLVENTGNVHSDAEYILQVFPLLSDEEVYTNEEDPETHIVLPGTRRFVTQSWDGAPSLGIFKVKQTVKFAGNESVTEKIVIICPMWLVFLVIFGVVFLIVYLIARSKMRKGSSSSKPAHSAPAA